MRRLTNKGGTAMIRPLHERSCRGLFFIHKGGDPVQANGKKTKTETSCDSCANLVYDEDYEEYVCDVDMDEDDYGRLMADRSFTCPYYRNGDEYAVVRHQM